MRYNGYPARKIAVSLRGLLVGTGDWSRVCRLLKPIFGSTPTAVSNELSGKAPKHGVAIDVYCLQSS